METRICRLHAKNDLRVETIPLVGPGRGEVLVALGAGGICGSDLHYWQDGGFGPIRVQEPIIMGHEAAGTVVELGEGVTVLRVGDTVALNPSHPCGTCAYCLEGNPQHCLTMRFKGSALRFPHEQGMFRDRIAIGAAQCHLISPGVNMSAAACAEPLAVCLRAVGRAEERIGTLHGKRVLVTGAGPIGALCAALAAKRGAAEVIVTDLQDATLAVARKMGATQTVNVRTNADDLAPWLADKGQIDLTFECSAAAPALRQAIAATRPLGTIIQVGVTGDMPIPLNLLVGKEIGLIGTHRFDAEFGEAVALINSGDLALDAMVTHSFPLEEATEAMTVAADRSQSVKVQIVF
ncbi:MAG: L-idonate 5-dehydrogenase [Paracoccaceae bacterium]